MILYNLHPLLLPLFWIWCDISLQICNAVTYTAQWKEDTDTMYKPENTDTSKTTQVTTQEIE